jgi:hypothetical protein
LKESFTRDVVGCLKQAYLTVNTMLCENSAIDTYMSGTTAALLICLEDDDRVVVANVGDSRVLLGKESSSSESEKRRYSGVQLTTYVVYLRTYLTKFFQFLALFFPLLNSSRVNVFVLINIHFSACNSVETTPVTTKQSWTESNLWVPALNNYRSVIARMVQCRFFDLK